VNEQIAEMATFDLFIGIMWNKIGTSTPRAASGTLEEFDAAMKAKERNPNLEIWFYFNSAAKSLNTLEETQQRAKVIEFKDKLRKNGIPKDYGDASKFPDAFRHDLTIWLAKMTAKTPAAPAQTTVAANRTSNPSIRQLTTVDRPIPLVVNKSGAWALLDDTFFLTERVEHRSNGEVQLTIEAADAEEDAKLRSMQSHSTGNTSVPYAYQNEAGIAEIRGARLISKAGNSKWEVNLTLSDTNFSPHLSNMTYNGVTSGQMANKRARLLLLNELPPKGQLSDLYFVGTLANRALGMKQHEGIFPTLWAQFKGNHETFLPLARLFAVFHLIASDTVEQILDLTLGPISNGELQVHFRGRRTKYYTNIPAEVITISGTCKLS
jgi:hypothetical protein